MKNTITRLKNNTRLILPITLAACLLMTGVYLAPHAVASMTEEKGKKSESKEENKTPEWLVRARRARRQMKGLETSERKKGSGARAAATNELAERQAEQTEEFISPFDFSPDRLFKYIFGQKSGNSSRVGEAYDEPREAARHFIKKRLPEGEKELPVDKYFEAQERMRGMLYFSTALDRQVSDRENFSAPLNRFEHDPNTATWTPLGPGNIGGRTRAILINPQDANLMYAAGVSGGVWKTTNGGQSWAPIADLIGNITVSSMAMEPGDPNVIYVGTGEGVYGFEEDTSVGDFRGAGIFKTTDGGANWTRLEGTKNENFYYINDLVVSPNNKNRIYAATQTGVWRSTDGGVNWTRVLNALNDDDNSVIGGCLDLAIRTDKQTDFVFASCGTFEPATIYRNT